jgi:2-isopropylmalate synthase
MEAEHGFSLPRRLQIEFSRTIQSIAEDTGTEISPTAMWDAFSSTYLPDDPAIGLRSHEMVTDAAGTATVTAQLVVDGEPVTTSGTGNGPIAAFVASLRSVTDSALDVVDYSEHSLGVGADAVAVAYVETTGADGTVRWGVGTDPSITTASFRAVLSALNRRRSGAV